MYEITIKKTEVTTATEAQSFQKIADTGGEDGGAKYGYVTKPPHEKDVTTTVFSQTMDNLNIIDVVAAVNGVTFNI